MGSITMEIGNDGVAVITMLNPPVNALTLSGSSLFFFLFYYNKCKRLTFNYYY